MTTSKALQRYLDIVDHFDTVMLVTRRDEQLRARPMSVAECTDDGRLLFITSLESGKLEEISDEPVVNITMQQALRFMSVTGSATAYRNEARIEELWSVSYEPWFPEGRDDPSITIIEFIPHTAEYWDNSGMEGIKALLELGKAAITDEKPVFEDSVHDTVDLRNRPAKSSEARA